ncbi:MAG TPA: hypothetical protein VMU89_09325, partial [Thermomicrobiaceae bacterium]|nr:hypothetical protein [Thermomicrobiaceae bacterium]
RVVANLQRQVPQRRREPNALRSEIELALAQWDLRCYLIEERKVPGEDADLLVAWVVAHGLNPAGWPDGPASQETETAAMTALRRALVPLPSRP